MDFRNMAMPMINQDRRIVDTFPQPYDEYCTPYEQVDFSEQIRNVISSNRPVRLQPCKAIFIGDVAVGKTTIVNRFCYDKYQNTYKATIGVDFEVEHFRILGQCFNLQIWDTAGQERFKCIAQAYYRSANVIIIVYDMTKEESLHATSTWLESALIVNSIQKPMLFLVGTKSDLLSKEEFKTIEKLGYEVARGMRAEYWSVSARTGFNIIELFQRISSLSFESMMKQVIIETNFFAKRSETAKQGFLQNLANRFEFNKNNDSTTKSKCMC